MGLQPSEYWEMSFDEIGEYIEVMQEKEEDDLKLELNMRYNQALMTSAEKPHKVYKEIWKRMFKPKVMTNEEMSKSAMAIAQIFGGNIKKKEGD